MISVYKQIFSVLSSRERSRAILLVTLMTLMAIMDVLGIASISPFLAVLGNPEVVESNQYLNKLYHFMGFTNTNEFLITLAGGALAFLVLASTFKAFVHYAQFRFINMRLHSLSIKLLERYLKQPYEFFLKRNSSDLTKTILSEVQQMINQALAPALNLISSGVTVLLLIVLIVIIDPVVAFILLGFIGGFYGLLYFSVRNYLQKIGKKRLAANQQRFQSINEMFGGIKELKVLGGLEMYYNTFMRPSLQFCRYQTLNQILGTLPKFAVEVIGFTAVLGAAVYLMLTRENFGEVLPILGIYTFTGYRLLPALQSIYVALAKLRFGLASLDDVIRNFKDTVSQGSGVISKSANESIVLKKSVEFRDVNFKYDSESSFQLRNINLTVPVGSVIGIMGETGAGKSTFVDILLGLLSPTQGEVLIDGNPLRDSELSNWLSIVGYVPQHIFLADDSIKDNVAFGQNKEGVSELAVREALKVAQLSDFIETLPEGIETKVGERGVRLSGGQRQRLGIARALYKNPSVLILDEATSALDLETEKKVMKALEVYSNEKTVFMIAHRTQTLQDCDKIIQFKDGEIVSVAQAEEVLGHKLV